jgi:DNA-binding CsgD family transcriptional regulator
VSITPTQVVGTTAEAAFVTDGSGGIRAWNESAKTLLGYDEHQARGAFCYQLLCGTDVFGNRFCDRRCPLVNMVRRGEAIHTFELALRHANSNMVRMHVSTIITPTRTDSSFEMIHLLYPIDHERPVLDALNPKPQGHNVAPAFSQLSPREITVLQLLAEGMSTRKTADTLCISIETVRNHVKHILGKLDVHCRIDAILFARRNRLL